MARALGALAARFATRFEAFDQATAEDEGFEPPELLDQSLASLTQRGSGIGTAHGQTSRHLGIDSSAMEANASLRTLVHRNTEQAYWEYAKELASQEGIDPEDEGAVRRFDKKRPEAGRAIRNGRTRMIPKPR